MTSWLVFRFSFSFSLWPSSPNTCPFEKLYQLSNEENPGCLRYIWDEILSSYMGIIISRYKFPYETTVGVFFFFVAQLRPLHLTAMVLLARPGGFSTNHWGGKVVRNLLSVGISTMSTQNPWKNKGFGHLKINRLTTITTSQNAGFGGPYNEGFWTSETSKFLFWLPFGHFFRESSRLFGQQEIALAATGSGVPSRSIGHGFAESIHKNLRNYCVLLALWKSVAATGPSPTR